MSTYNKKFTIYGLCKQCKNSCKVRGVGVLISCQGFSRVGKGIGKK